MSHSATPTTSTAAAAPESITQKAAKFQATFQELKQKELNYQQSRTADIEAALDITSQEVNWPFVYPIVRHDLDDVAVVSVSLHALCKYSYGVWRHVLANLALNFALTGAFFWFGLDGLFTLVYAGVGAVLLPFLFFAMSHYPLYRGSLRRRKLLLALSIVGSCVEVALSGLMLVGAVEGAGGGVFRLLNLLRLRRWILLGLTGALQLSVFVSILLMLNLIRRIIGQVRVSDVRAEVSQQTYNSVREDAFQNIRTLAKDILN